MSRMIKMPMTAVLILLAACSGLERTPKIDDGIVTAEAVTLRNSVAQLALEVGQVTVGEKVEVLERRGTDWVKIRTSAGLEGWIEAHTVAKEALVQEANALAEQVKDKPTQAVGFLSGPSRLRVSPGRATDENAVMTLSRQTVVEVLDRQRTLRESGTIVPKVYQPTARPPQSQSSEGEVEEYDDWCLVRLPKSPVVGAGWVYTQLVSLQIPSRLVRLQEDHYIIGWFEVGQLEDSEIGAVSSYLALSRRRYGSTHGTDFNRLELFWWHPDRHRYFRSTRILHGILPVQPENRDGAWVFQMKAYDQKARQFIDTGFLVDVRDPYQPKFVPVKK